MKRISKSKLKPAMLEVFREIENSGADMVVTDRGKPVLLISPYSEDADAVLNSLRGTVLRYTDPTGPVGSDDWDMLS